MELSARLAVGLRYFAGGCPLHLSLIYKISKAHVFRCIWLAVDAINNHLINFPIDDADVKRWQSSSWAFVCSCYRG